MSREVREAASLPMGLDLAERRSVGDLIGTTVRLWTSRPTVFLLVALLISVPVELLVIGVLGDGFGRPYGTSEPWADVAWTAIGLLLIDPLVVAAHASALVALDEGRDPRTRDVLRAAVASAPVAVPAAAVYLVATALGLLALGVGAFVVGTFGVFAVGFAAVERRGPFDAFRLSVRLVRASGAWRTFGFLLLACVILIAAIVAIAAVAILFSVLTGFDGEDAGTGALLTVLVAVVSAGLTSIALLFTTLMFFAWRAGAEPGGGPGRPTAPGGDEVGPGAAFAAP